MDDASDRLVTERLESFVDSIVRGLNLPSDLAAEARADFLAHLETAVHSRRGRGEPLDAAIAAAIARFGPTDVLRRRLQEAGQRRAARGRPVVRVLRGDAVMITWFRDAQHALRGLRKTPGLTLVVASTLALGIGANAAVFSLIKGTLLAVPPFPDAGRVLRISSVVERTGQILGSSMPDVRDWRAQTTAFVDLAAYFTIPTQMAGERLAESVDVTWVSPGFFEVIGLSPLYGRTPREDEFARGADVFKVVLAHGFWRRAFGGDPAVVGRSIRLYRQSFTVVGVMPTAVDYPGGTDLWAPMQGLFGALNSDPRSDFRQRRWHRVVGRVRPALDVATANAELDTIGRRLAAEYPGTNRDIRVRAVTLHEAEVGDLRPYFLLLLGAVGFVLLICCANVANLQLARGHSRLRELAVRSAMGATRPRLLRELFIEQVVVAVLGGLLGLAGAHWLLAILMRLVPVDLPS
ncbi:MAG TPA: ABC transporter permease, partial [Vicinamibacterales bacterium]|nr:ABC transporter permease [Vicinamibacterales bacterium]